MIISAIVATAHDNVIGKKNEIPWYLPADLKYFKRTTLGHHILMGRNSHESIGKPLPGRVNIVVTRQAFYKAKGCMVVNSLEEGIEFARHNGEEELFIIGGAQIYEQSLPLWDKLYQTVIDLEVDGGDAFFPAIGTGWEELSSVKGITDDKNEFEHYFKVLHRAKKNKPL